MSNDPMIQQVYKANVCGAKLIAVLWNPESKPCEADDRVRTYLEKFVAVHL